MQASLRALPSTRAGALVSNSSQQAAVSVPQIIFLYQLVEGVADKSFGEQQLQALNLSSRVWLSQEFPVAEPPQLLHHHEVGPQANLALCLSISMLLTRASVSSYMP